MGRENWRLTPLVYRQRVFSGRAPQAVFHRMDAMHVLALEPYYGGSHRAFLDGWAGRSRHRWTTLTLPAHSWKWRMRHAPVTLAQQVEKLIDQGQSWDVLWCSDMLSLADFRGLAPSAAARLPAVVYFHENQLTYPVRRAEERDLHFAFSNLTTCLAADAVWFNSRFHQNEFMAALRGLLANMPDHQPLECLDLIQKKTSIEPPGVDAFPPRPNRMPGPLCILWAARWEHDKNPEAFFAAIESLAERGVPFRLSVVGESFRDVPPVFAMARNRFAASIDRWGFQPSREEYQQALLEADVVASTAMHEFFGIAVVEACAAGAFPLLPRRLSYGELLQLDANETSDEYFYNSEQGDAAGLANALDKLARRLAEQGNLWQDDPQRCRQLVNRFTWNVRAAELDAALHRTVEQASNLPKCS